MDFCISAVFIHTKLKRKPLFNGFCILNIVILLMTALFKILNFNILIDLIYHQVVSLEICIKQDLTL